MQSSESSDHESAGLSPREAGLPHPRVVLMGEMNSDGNLSPAGPIVLAALMFCPMEVPTSDGPALGVCTLADVVGDLVTGAENTLSIPADRMLALLSEPETLADLPVMARCAVLLLAAQVYEACAARTGNRSLLNRALEIAERVAELAGDAAAGWVWLGAELRTLSWSAAGVIGSDPFEGRPHARALATSAGATGQEADRPIVALLASLPTMLIARFRETSQREDLDAAIAAHERVLAGAPAEADGLLARYDALTQLLALRYQLSADARDLDRIIAVQRSAVSTASSDVRGPRLYALANALWERAAFTHEVSDHAEAVSVLTRLVDQMPTDDPARPNTQAALGMAELQLGRQTGDRTSIDRALDLIHTAVDGLPDDAPELPRIRRDQAVALRDRAQRDNSQADVERSVELLEWCIEAAASAGDEMDMYLVSLGLTLQVRHMISGRRIDLDRAIDAYAAAVKAATHRVPGRIRALHNLYQGLLARYARDKQTGDAEAMEAALAELSQLKFDTAWQWQAVIAIARSVEADYLRSGNPTTLTHAIEAIERQASVAEGNSADEHEAQIQLASLLWRQYGVLGDVALLHRAVDLLDELLCHMPPKSAKRPDAYSILGMCLRDRYLHEGRPGDLDRAIAGYQSALAMAGISETERSEITMNLGLAMWDHYHRTGNLQELDQSIALLDGALEHISSESEIRAVPLNTLGIALSDRFDNRSNPADLSWAVRALEEAISLLPPQAAIRATILNNLGNALLRTYELTNDLNLLTRSIAAFDQSVKIAEPARPDRPRFLSNLANGLRIRYDRTRQIEDLEQAVQLTRQAVTEAPPDWADRAVSLMALGGHAMGLYLQLGRSRDRDLAVESLRDGCRAALNTRPGSTLHAAGIWSAWAAGEGAWDEAAEACDLAIAAMIGLFETQFGRHDKEVWLSAADGIPARAAYAHAMRGDPVRAVEALERGRALQLSEALSSDAEQLEDLVALGHGRRVQHYREAAATFAGLMAEAEHPQTLVSSALIAQQEGLTTARHALNEAVSSIREVLPDFRRAPDFADLVAAADMAPLVYVAPTELGGVALVVWGARRPAQPVDTIWLPELTNSAARRRFSDVREAQRAATSDPGTWHGVLDAAAAWLWDAAMAPLLTALSAEPRAVLIPTGYMSMLPLHAAWTSDTTRPTSRRYATDDLLISYAPNARALLAAAAVAKRGASGNVLVVEDPHPTRHGALPFAAVEAAAVGEHFGAARTRTLRREHATLADVQKALSTSTIVHFACHGIAHPMTPLDSAIILANDEPLTLGTLLRLARVQQRGAIRLAVLSTCESQLPGQQLPDEVVSLPTGLLQAGAAGVVATQWVVSGLAAALLITCFYTEWLGEQHSPAAALQSAARWLRDTTNKEKAAALKPLAQQSPLSRSTTRALWREIVRRPPEERSFSQVSDWAAFSYVGA